MPALDKNQSSGYSCSASWPQQGMCLLFNTCPLTQIVGFWIIHWCLDMVLIFSQWQTAMRTTWGAEIFLANNQIRDTPGYCARANAFPHFNDLSDCIRIEGSIFAEDSTVYVIGLPNNRDPTPLSLSAAMSKAVWWAQTWGMLFSAEKSDVLTIGKRKGHHRGDEHEQGEDLNGWHVSSCLSETTLVCRSTTACRGRIMLMSCTQHVLVRSVCCQSVLPLIGREPRRNVLQRFVLGTSVPAWNTHALFIVEAVHRSYVIFMNDSAMSAPSGTVTVAGEALQVSLAGDVI